MNTAFLLCSLLALHSAPAVSVPHGSSISATSLQRPAHGSAHALVHEVLQGLRRNDTAALRGLAVSFKEFRSTLFPEFHLHSPDTAERPEERCDLLWQSYVRNTDAGLWAAFDLLAGERSRVVRLRLGDAPQRFGSFTIHEEPTIEVLLDDGEIIDFPFIGAIIERDGEFRVLYYRSS